MIEKKALDVEKAVLIGIITKTQDEYKLKEYLEELSFLVHTAGGNVIKSFVQKVSFPNTKTFVGPGKMKQVQSYVFNNDVATVIFDDELTPAQQTNLEKLLKCLQEMKPEIKLEEELREKALLPIQSMLRMSK